MSELLSDRLERQHDESAKQLADNAAVLSAAAWGAPPGKDKGNGSASDEVRLAGGYTPVAPPIKPFNGRDLCEQVVDQFSNHHIDLVDREKRKDWAQKWGAVCESDPRLETQLGADQVGEEIAKSLGRHYDNYLDAHEYSRFEKEQNSSAVSIGAEFAVWRAAEVRGEVRGNNPYDVPISRAHPLVVRSVLDGSPAAQAGLQPGDKILALDGELVYGKARRDITFGLAEKENSNVRFTVEREGPDRKPVRMSIDIAPRTISIPPVEHSHLRDGIDKIKLRTFTGDDVIEQMQAALDNAAKSKALILDLRNNGGGSTSNAREIISMLLPQGTIMSAKDRSFDSEERYRQALTNDSLIDRMPDHADVPRSRLRFPEDKPLVILVDEYTASSSEIAAGALRNRAKLIGVSTTGKRDGQTVIPLDNDRAVAVTSFEFHPGDEPASGRLIVPDIIVKNTRTQQDDQLRAAQAYLLKELRQRH